VVVLESPSHETRLALIDNALSVSVLRMSAIFSILNPLAAKS
jgi:hypothetical protein